MHRYSDQVEGQMRRLFDSLNEKDRRRYAAVEAAKLGHGGIAYVARLFDCHPDTVRRGLEDVQDLPEDAAEARVRKRGAVARMLAFPSQE